MYTLILIFSMSFNGSQIALASEKVEGFKSPEACEVAGEKAQRDLVHAPAAIAATRLPLSQYLTNYVINIKYSCVQVK